MAVPDDIYENQRPNTNGGIFASLPSCCRLFEALPSRIRSSQACNKTTGAKSVWSNYVLVSDSMVHKLSRRAQAARTQRVLAPR